MGPTKDQAEFRYKNLFAQTKNNDYKIFAGFGLIFLSFLFFLFLVPVVQNYDEELFDKLNQELHPPVPPIPPSERVPESEPEPEPEPTCGPGTVLKNGVCVVGGKKPPIENRLYSIITYVTIFGIAIMGSIFLYQGVIPAFDKQQKIFFEFYKTYVVLQKFVDLKNNGERNNAIDRIYKLSYYIENWISDRAPSSIAKLPHSIKENLNKKLIPLIYHQKYEEISDFNQQILKFAYLVYENDPNEDELIKLDETIKSLPLIPEEKPPKIIKQTWYQENTKAIVSSIIVTTALGLVLMFSELGWGAIVLGSVGIGFIVFLGLRKVK